jgi:hypothetical protein
MLVNFLIKEPNQSVETLSQQMTLRTELKRQHYAAFNYRLKRFAVTKVGLLSAFTAGAVFQANNHSETNFVKKYAWLTRLLV